MIDIIYKFWWPWTTLVASCLTNGAKNLTQIKDKIQEVQAMLALEETLPNSETSCKIYVATNPDIQSFYELKLVMR